MQSLDFFLLEKLVVLLHAGGRECRAGCLFQAVARIGEISNYKDNGLLSGTDVLRKHKTRLR